MEGRVYFPHFLHSLTKLTILYHSTLTVLEVNHGETRVLTILTARTILNLLYLSHCTFRTYYPGSE